MTSVRRLLARTVGLAQQGVLIALPHGGQRSARANAWAEVRVGCDRQADRVSAAAALRQRERASAERPAYAVGGR